MRASRVPRVPFLACVAALALRATCVAAGGSADDLARATREALAEAFASKATKLSSPPRFDGAEVTVYPPRSLADPRRGGHEGNDGTKYPVVVFLHGFCLPDENQQKYNFTATRAGAGVGGTPRRQTLTQIGLRDFVDDAFYVTPTSPTTTRQCALCNLGDDSPNVADRLTTSWINNTLARIAPAFVCNTWDGSDACCAPEKGGEGNDVAFIADVIRAVVDGEHKSFVDENRVYLVGIATGGRAASPSPQATRTTQRECRSIPRRTETRPRGSKTCVPRKGKGRPRSLSRPREGRSCRRRREFGESRRRQSRNPRTSPRRSTRPPRRS